MKSTLSALILVGGIVLLFGGRQPVGADPVREDKAGGEPVIVALAPLKKEKAPDPLAEKVKEAQEKAINYLKSRQKEVKKDVANWESDTLTLLQPGGSTALALVALLESGLKPDDPVVATGLNYLRELKPQHTYVVSLTTQVFCKANQKKDAELIKTNVKWLEDAALWIREGQLLGWSYTANSGNRADNSNSRYAVSGLYAAHKVGFKVNKEKFWEAVREYYVRTQAEGGGWTYQNESRAKNRGTHTMTLSGVLGLLQAKDILGKDDKDAERARQAGFEWIAKEFTIKNPPHTLYNIDLIAAVGRASERKDLGTKEKKREWYREGAEWLIENQKPGGEWRIDRSAIDEFPIISTSFALRFLASRPED
jgi:hypothetical protein